MASIDQLVQRLLSLRCRGERTAAPAGAPPVRANLADFIGPTPPIGRVPSIRVYSTVPPPSRQLTLEDPWRTFLFFQMGAASGVVSPVFSNQVQGITIAANGSLRLTKINDGAIVCRAWFWHTAAGPSSVQVLEQ